MKILPGMLWNMSWVKLGLIFKTEFLSIKDPLKKLISLVTFFLADVYNCTNNRFFVEN